MKKLSDIALRVVWLIIACIGGWLLFLITANLMIMAGLFSGEGITQGVGYALVEKVVIVWIVASILCLGSLFTREKIRLLFLSLPFILPTLFGVIYGLTL